MENPKKQRLFELVTGVVRLDKFEEFKRLHRDHLLPLFEKYNIKPSLLLFTEVGAIGRFYDIYEYKDMEDYDKKIQGFLSDPSTPSYYEAIQPCLIGSIETVLLRAFDYSPIQ